MAVYEGARRRAIAVPRTLVPGGLRSTPDAPALPRRRTRRARFAVRAGRPSWVGLSLATIVVLFALAFFSLAQSVRVAATSYDIDRLGVDRDRLQNWALQLDSDLNRLGKAPAIRKLGHDAGLVQLGEPLILPAD